MLVWLAENIGTILILAALIAIVAAIIVSMRRDKRGANPPAAVVARTAR